MRRAVEIALLSSLTVAVACQGQVTEMVDDGVDAGASAPDAADPGERADGAPMATGVAPQSVRPDALVLDDGDNPINVPVGGEVVFRVETSPDEHTAFDLRFPVGIEGVELAVDRWNGDDIEQMAITNGGAGLRVLAVFDSSGPRTFWVRVYADEAIDGATLSLVRTTFVDGVMCGGDCARLLQLPLPNDSAIDGYDVSGSIYRYQFGRRDMVMFIRHAGKQVVAAGMKPFRVADLSQWNAETPGRDTGALRHASHQRGKDVDISLYGDDGEAPFRSYCTAVNNGNGRECVAGSESGYDGYANSIMFAAFYDSLRVTMCFLDRELIPPTRTGAQQASIDGFVSAGALPLFSDGTHLQHWPNHDNHIHVRVSEAEGAVFGVEPFEAP